MGAMKDRYEHLIEEIKAEAAKLFGHADPEVHAVAEKVAAAVAELQGDVPAVEAEAKADAVDLATETVEAEKPVAEKAIADGEHLAGEVGTDAKETVESFEHPGDCAAVEHPAGFEPPTSATPPAKAAN